MKNSLAILFWAIGLSVAAVFAVYKKTALPTKPAATKKPTNNPKPKLASIPKIISSNHEIAPAALPNVVTPEYELKIYGAFAFVPDDSTANFMKADSGHQFVVLDVAVQNKSRKKAIDIGQVIRSATVMDKEGNVYPRNALAIEAFEMQYPEQNHKAEYKAMKGKIAPGAYYRTTAYGFEAPDNVKEFIISLPEKTSFLEGAKFRTANFFIY